MPTDRGVPMTDREQQEVERLRWVFWECDCGALNREARPGFQHPCPACGHPATIDPVEVMPVSEHEAALQAEREKTEAARRQRDAAERELAAAHKKSAAPGGEVCQRITPEQRSASRLPAEQPDMADISGRSEAKDKPPITAHTEQPDTEGGDADATHCGREDRQGKVGARKGGHVAGGAAVDDGRALDQCPTCGSGLIRLHPQRGGGDRLNNPPTPSMRVARGDGR